MNRFTAVYLLFAVGVLCGCSRSTAPTESVAESGGGHTHVAPHGGHLVELGDHAASLEFVMDAVNASLNVYVLDGHADGYVRLAVPMLKLEAKLAGAPEPIAIKLHGVENPLTGETIGDTSHFSGTVPQLAGQTEVSLTIPSIEVGGATYSGITTQISP